MSYKLFFFLLLMLMVAVGGYLRYQANGDINSYFNQTTRLSLGKSDFGRWALGLHKAGDARVQYFHSAGPLVIEVVVSKGLEINDEGLRHFADEAGKMTGQKVSVVNVDTMDGQSVNNSDLPDLISRYRRHRSYGQPDVFVIYASDFEGSDDVPARPFNEFGIVISDSKLKQLTRDNSLQLPQYLSAVMLYSFGRQLGLSDGENSSCIMQPHILRPVGAVGFSNFSLPSSYCDEDIAKAQAMKIRTQ